MVMIITYGLLSKPQLRNKLLIGTNLVMILMDLTYIYYEE